MAEAIKKEFGVEPEMVKGSGGVFEVTVDGELIFSKHQTGRFPTNEEILEEIRRRAG